MSGELNDEALQIFLVTIVNSVTNLSKQLVYPRWQPEPPILPPIGTDWGAVGIMSSDPDIFATVAETSDNASFGVIRNEVLEVLCSFYGPNSEANSKLLRNGLSLPQNREQLQLNGFGLMEVGKGIQIPEQIKGRWMRRTDVTMLLRRLEIYEYQIPTITGFGNKLLTDVGLPPISLTVKGS